MKILSKAKDGGPDSTVTGYWLIEAKKLFSIALLKFEHGSRDAFHSHAFNSVNWILKGCVDEEHTDGRVERRRAGLSPWYAMRNTFHQVFSNGTTWVLSIRGPWAKTWQEYDPGTGQTTVLTHGRQVVS